MTNVAPVLESRKGECLKNSPMPNDEMMKVLSQQFIQTDFGQVAQLLATAIPRQKSAEFGRALAPLVETVSAPPRPRRLRQEDIDIDFDESVSPEKALKFLVAFAEELANIGGRLCLRKRKEGE